MRCVFQGQKAISVSRSGPWLSRRPSTAVCRVHRRLLKQNGPWAGRCKVHVPPSLSAGSPATTGEGKLSCSRAKAQKAPLRSNPMQLDGLCARRNQLWCWRTGRWQRPGLDVPQGEDSDTRDSFKQERIMGLFVTKYIERNWVT